MHGVYWFATTIFNYDIQIVYNAQFGFFLLILHINHIFMMEIGDRD